MLVAGDVSRPAHSPNTGSGGGGEAYQRGGLRVPRVVGAEPSTAGDLTVRSGFLDGAVNRRGVRGSWLGRGDRGPRSAPTRGVGALVPS